MEPGPASWTQPLARFDAWWTKWEARLATAVLGAEILSLVTWILLKGMSAEYQPSADPEVPVDVSGVMLRGVLGALVLGTAANLALRDQDPAKRKTDLRHQAGVAVAVALGLIAGRFWANVGSAYFSNLLNWLQSASTLTLLGGLRGLATRLTLWLALLGGSLATAQGKHINVDVAMRLLPARLRLPVTVVGWLAAALVCLSGAVGFVEHITVVEFKDPPSLTHDVGRDMFLLRQQARLDLHTLPKVLSGTKYQDHLKARAWNDWLESGGWTSYFSHEDVMAQRMDEADTQARLPLINLPGMSENTNGLLIRDLDFVFPFGLLMIALRFLLRSLLAVGGAVRVDPDAAHAEEGLS